MKYPLKEGFSFVIFTDMDGTLLDHHTYAWDAASPAINAAQSLNIPIIPCTSKTIAETQELTRHIGLEGPIIGENGGGYFADGNLVALGNSAQELVANLSAIRNDYGFDFTGMSEMDLDKVIEVTGLDPKGATHAKQRQFSEPFLWHEENTEQMSRFAEAARSKHIDIIKGGRFYHAMSRGVSKGNAMQALLKKIGLHGAASVIALGDSDNDISMLSASDIAIVVNNPTRNFPEIAHPKGLIEYTSEFGPKGWNTAILKILESYYG